MKKLKRKRVAVFELMKDGLAESYVELKQREVFSAFVTLSVVLFVIPLVFSAAWVVDLLLLNKTKH